MYFEYKSWSTDNPDLVQRLPKLPRYICLCFDTTIFGIYENENKNKNNLLLGRFLKIKKIYFWWLTCNNC